MKKLFYSRIYFKECDYFTYNVEMSQSAFPTEWYYNMSVTSPDSELYPDVYERIKKIKSYSDARNYYLSFNIYYSDLSYAYIEESPYWDLFLLLSNIGGNLGLFVGMSFLSFVEIFELLFQLAEFAIIAFINMKKTQPATINVMPFNKQGSFIQEKS